MLFPSWETLPHERLSPRADTVGRRLAVLRRLAHPERVRRCAARVVVTTVRSMIQPLAPHLGELAPVRIATGAEIDLAEVTEQLTMLAYSRVDLVTKRGEIAVRGGILDLFPPTAEHPYRIEFWGDEVSRDPHLRGHRPALHRPGRRRRRAAVPGDPADPGRPGRGRPAVGRGAPVTRRWPRCWRSCRPGSPSRAWRR